MASMRQAEHMEIWTESVFSETHGRGEPPKKIETLQARKKVALVVRQASKESASYQEDCVAW